MRESLPYDCKTYFYNNTLSMRVNDRFFIGSLPWLPDGKIQMTRLEIKKSMVGEVLVLI